MCDEDEFDAASDMKRIIIVVGTHHRLDIGRVQTGPNLT